MSEQVYLFFDQPWGENKQNLKQDPKILYNPQIQNFKPKPEIPKNVKFQEDNKGFIILPIFENKNDLYN